VIGLGLAYAGLGAFRTFSLESYFQSLTINTNLLAFTFALSVLAPVLFSVMPALQSSRPDLNEDLKDGGRTLASSARGGRSRSVLVVAQIGFTCAVLIVSGLIVRSVIAMERVPLGLNPDGLLTVRVRFDPPRYADDAERLRAVETILERLTAVPGVAAVGASRRLPIVEGEPARRFTIAGQPVPAAKDLPWAFEAGTLGDYTSAIELRVFDGRMWRPEDRASGWRVAVVNREAVRRYWAGRSPIGDRLTMADASGRPSGDPVEIVGVVDNVLGSSVNDPPPPRIYRPLAVGSLASVGFLVRAGSPAAVAPAVREALRAQDRDLAMSDVRTAADEVKVEMRSQDLIMALFVGFAAIGLVVAIAGVYGVTAFAVGQRRHELGIRLALGATAGGVVRLIVGGSFRLVAAGVVLGLFGGWAIGSLIGNVLVGVSATDSATSLAVLGLVLGGAFVATYVPAHRVISIDPATVLKRD
jgi:putative ABC transport system permease protein